PCRIRTRCALARDSALQTIRCNPLRPPVVSVAKSPRPTTLEALMRATLTVFTLAALMALPIAAAAQVNTATINGIVSDESKAILPGATVTASDLATGRKYVGVSDERGAYKISVPPGTYQVQAELSGFGNAEVPRVELLVGQNASIAFTLKISSLAETLTVTGEAPLVDLTSTQVA